MDRRGDKQTSGSDAFERGDTAIELPLGKQDHFSQEKDGAKRFVVDYRSLNDCTKKDSYPLPEMRYIFDKLGNSQFYSTLDGASAYCSIPICPEDIGKTRICYSKRAI